MVGIPIPFWKGVQDFIVKDTQHILLDEPLVDFIHAFPRSIGLYKRSSLPYLLNTAKSLIFLLWRQSKAHMLREWLTRVQFTMEAEEWVHKVQNCYAQFILMWGLLNLIFLLYRLKPNHASSLNVVISVILSGFYGLGQ